MKFGAFGPPLSAAVTSVMSQDRYTWVTTSDSAAVRNVTAAAAKLFCELDYLISPVSPVVNFPAEFAAPLNDPEKPFEHIGYTMPWNMAENPAVSINGGYDSNGFPIGVQIVGRRFDDIGVLSMAKAFEGLRGPQRPWPTPPQK